MKKMLHLKKHTTSLSGKIIIIITVFIFMCAILWTSIMFINMTGNAKDIAINNEKAYMKTFETNLNSVQEVCNLAKQFVSENNTVIEYIKLRQQGKEYSTIEKIKFYNHELAFLENMTNINPYLYQVRLFVNADITERKPSFYKIERM